MCQGQMRSFPSSSKALGVTGTRLASKGAANIYLKTDFDDSSQRDPRRSRLTAGGSSGPPSPGAAPSLLPDCLLLPTAPSLRGAPACLLLHTRRGGSHCGQPHSHPAASGEDTMSFWPELDGVASNFLKVCPACKIGNHSAQTIAGRPGRLPSLQ